MSTSSTNDVQRSTSPGVRRSTLVIGIIFVALILLPRLFGIDSYLITDLGIAFSAALVAFLAVRTPADATSEEPRSSWGLKLALWSFGISALFALSNAIGRLLVYWTNSDPNALLSHIDPLAELGNRYAGGPFLTAESWVEESVFDWTGLLCVWVVYLAAAAVGAAMGSLLQRMPNKALRIVLGIAGVIIVWFFAPALYDPAFTTPFRPVPYVLISFSTIFALAITLAVGILPIRSDAPTADSSAESPSDSSSDPLSEKGEGPAPQN